jgi:hypothetical protein
MIVEPTFDDFAKNPRSVRHGYLACFAIYHAVDRAAFPKKPGNLLRQWRKESLDFLLVEIVANHIKHVKSDVERLPLRKKAIPIHSVLGFGSEGDGLELRNLYFVMRDAIEFIHSKASPK